MCNYFYVNFKIYLRNSNLNISREKERINLLLEEIDFGFTHFDTSPLYNFGFSEKDLGIAKIYIYFIRFNYCI